VGKHLILVTPGKRDEASKQLAQEVACVLGQTGGVPLPNPPGGPS
jgi:hypothetical protein